MKSVLAFRALQTYITFLVIFMLCPLKNKKVASSILISRLNCLFDAVFQEDENILSIELNMKTNNKSNLMTVLGYEVHIQQTVLYIIKYTMFFIKSLR